MFKVSELDSEEYDSYYEPYVAALGNVSLKSALETSLLDISGIIAQIPDDKMHFAYAEGKWSISEILVHLKDTERIFQYRALRFARNDKTELKGFDQDHYVMESAANFRTKDNLLQEFIAVRKSSIALFKSFSKAQLLNKGRASESIMSVRALGFVICGHQAHHLKIIRQRYLD